MTESQGHAEPGLAGIEPAGGAAVLGRAASAGLALGGRDARPTGAVADWPAVGCAAPGEAPPRA